MSKTLNGYIDCITKKFSIEALQNESVHVQDLIEWYKTFKRAYTSKPILIKALKQLNYKNVALFEQYLVEVNNQEQNESSLYAECVALGYTDTLKNMAKFVNDIRIRNLSEKELLEICTNQQDNYSIVYNRIIVLKVLGYETQIIENEREHREQRLQKLRKLFDLTKIRLGHLKEIDCHFNGVNRIDSLSVSELVHLASTSKHTSAIMRIYEVLLQDETKILKIRTQLSHRCSRMNKANFFLCNRSNDSLRHVLDEVLLSHKIRLQNTSSYTEDRLKDIELRIVHFLEFCDKHIEQYDVLNTNHESNDSLLHFFKNCTQQNLYDMIMAYGQNSNHDNTKVKSKTGRHHQARQNLNVAIRFLRDIAHLCANTDYILSLKTSEFLNLIENKSELLDWDKRRVYTDEEIDNMLVVVESDPRDTLLITLLREIGLRNAAICNLKFESIVDEHYTPRHVCRVKEKGNKIREFVTSPNLKRKIASYVHVLRDENTYDVTKYVFSRSASLTTRLGYSTLNVVLKRIAVRAGVTNVNVQAHSFRHTLVGKLMNAGNNIETVSKFMGHSSVDTTMTYYWLKSVAEIAKEINNPFVNTQPSVEEEKDNIDYLNKKIDTCFNIIGLYREEIFKAQTIEELRNTIAEHNQQVDRVLRFIANSDTESVLTNKLNSMNA